MCNLFETDFTLTDGYRGGIINSWHYPKRVGVKIMETTNTATETTESVETALAPKTKLNGKVLKTTLAGALIDVGQNVPGVIHISQLSEDSINKVEDVVKEGQTVEVWVRRVKKD